jgi:hypothetical protein
VTNIASDTLIVRFRSELKMPDLRRKIAQWPIACVMMSTVVP